MPASLLPPPPQPVYTPPTVGQECEVNGYSHPLYAYGQTRDANPLSVLQRKYTILKVLSHRHASGSTNTVCICSWHTPSSLNPNLPPLLKRTRFGEENQVVIVKSRRTGDRPRDDNKLAELQMLRDLPPHENVIALYDYFFTSSEVHLVLGNMEGNLYQLIRTRRGRALAGGLISSILHQIAHGLNHIHSHGYYHFNLCPEKILVTSTGLFNYTIVPTSPGSNTSSTASKQKDVVVIIKLAGFNLARKVGSRAANLYSGISWYRAPEVTLCAPTPSTPVDMWAFGAIIGEISRLQPMFLIPATDSPSDILRIAETLGPPSRVTQLDLDGQPVDGGKWTAGYALAASMGLTFPEIPAPPLSSFFAPTTPTSLLRLIRRLLMYDPRNRLTSKECLDHAYFRETEPYRTIHPDRWLER